MRNALAVLLLAALVIITPPTALAVTIAWIRIGNPGNAFDRATGFGAVGYAYNIGSYDVTNSQYVEFLNAKDSTGANGLGLYTTGPNGMNNATYGGINYNAGNADGGKYSAISGLENHPVNYISWYSAIRFANWLNNGQGKGDTEIGTYTLLGGTPTPSNGPKIRRDAAAVVFLPSENEWYKAAYYNPATSSYFKYATSSNTAPTASLPPGDINSANYRPSPRSLFRNLTDIGAYTGTTSSYGAFDMAGNVFQWNETLMRGSFRGLRGGSFNSFSNTLLSSGRDNIGPPEGSNNIGFRVASLPSAK